MSKVSISLARTPFQLFNCIEAIKEFNRNGSNIVICIYKNKVDKKLFNEILKEYLWTKIYFFKLGTINKFFFPFILNKILKSYKKIEFCFFGLITSYIVHSINQINAKNNILIDDGNETFLIANNIKNNKYKDKFRNSLGNKILGIKISLDFIIELKIFTFFNLDSYFLNNIVLKNNFNNFKKSIDTLPEEKEIFFIGSNLIDSYISKQYFENIIKNVVEYYSDYKITYIPHRYEDLEYLLKISEKFNFKIKKFSTILELAILQYGRKPHGLISIRSTALETIGYLYDIDFLNIIQIDTDMLLKKEQVLEYKNLYKNYKQKKINLIDIT